MRVALLAPGFSAHEGDWSIPWLQNFVAQMSSFCELAVYALRYPPHTSPYSFRQARVYPLGWRQRAGLHRWLLYRGFMRSFTGHHQLQPYQLIHAFWGEEPGFLAVRLGHRLDMPVLVSLVGGELAALSDIRYGSLLGMQTHRMVAAALRAADRVIAPSGQMMEVACRQRPDVRARLGKIPLGVNLSLFFPDPDGTLEWSRTHKHVLHVSNLSPVKNPGLLLRTFQLIRQQCDAQLHVVGGESCPSWWEAEIDRLGLRGRVSLHAWTPHDQLAPYYRSAHLLLMTSRYEGYLNVVLEALACGCPVVSTPVGVVGELEPDLCRIVQPSPEALSQAALELLKRTSNIPRSRDRISALLTRYSLERMVEDYWEEYKRLADRPAALPRSKT